ncbi:MAG: hypothetical protein OXG65_02940 [Chloroflexi bacterium]|nr:hypothetical protein [Chloroflexota bacterium]
MTTLPAFTSQEARRAKLLLAAKVASMMGRKLEEDDWQEVYCEAKGIPQTGWSNLHIDVNHDGLGVEFKMLRVSQLRGRPIKEICGTSRMHPAATRSIRIEDIDLPPEDVMADVLTQYSELIRERTERVKSDSSDGRADMRTGWLLWEPELQEFLYFEERMERPNPEKFFAEWNETPARGIRKASKSLWIFDRVTGSKRFSVTTSAGIKIQPYFDVPPPNDPNVNYFRVQSEPLGEDTIVLWVSESTAALLREVIGSTDRQAVSDAVSIASDFGASDVSAESSSSSFAVPIHISKEAFDVLISTWDAVNDEHLIQKLIDALKSIPDSCSP